MGDTDAMTPELLKLIAFFGLPVLGLAYMVILTIVRDRRRRRAWDGLGEKLGWQGKWSKDDVGLRRLKLQGRHRDRDIALQISTVPFAINVTREKGLLIARPEHP